MAITGLGQHTERKQKGKSLLTFPSEYVAIDLETTGLDPTCNSIIEMAAVRVVNGEIVDTYSHLVNPGFPIDDYITWLTGITNEMLGGQDMLEDVLPEFLAFIGDSLVVAHNANFDINFLYDNAQWHQLGAFQNDFVDTMRLSRNLFPGERHHRLSDLVLRLGVGDKTEHRALADVSQTVECMKAMEQYAADHGITQLSISRRKDHLSKMISTENTAFDVDSPIYENEFVFTGTLDGMTRKEAMQMVVDRGGLVADSVTKKTNYLVIGNLSYAKSIKDGKSTKQKKAEKMAQGGHDIQTISENVFYDMLG